MQKKTSPLKCVGVTHCIKVPDSLEREPLPEAHPALLSHRRGPSGFLIYMSPPPKLLRRRCGVGDSRRRMTVKEPGLRMSASHPALTRHSILQPLLSSLHLKTLCPSTHVAASLMRKFHSLAGTHRFHRDTPPSGCTNREGEGIKCQSANQTAARLLLHLCSNHA